MLNSLSRHGGGMQNRLGHILSCSFKTQVSPHFLKGRFDRPASCESTDDLREIKTDVSGIKVFVPVRALNIMDKYPANRNQPFACFVPPAGISGKFDFAIGAAVPTDCNRDQFSAGYQLLRLWQFLAIGTRSSHRIFLFRWRKNWHHHGSGYPCL